MTATMSHHLLRGLAEVTINNVRTTLKVICEPGGGELVGVVGLRDLWHLPLVAFRLYEGGLHFADIDDDAADEAVASLFGIQPHEVRAACCKLLTAMLLPNARELTPAEVQQPAGAVVH